MASGPGSNPGSALSPQDYDYAAAIDPALEAAAISQAPMSGAYHPVLELAGMKWTLKRNEPHDLLNSS